MRMLTQGSDRQSACLRKQKAGKASRKEVTFNVPVVAVADPALQALSIRSKPTDFGN